MPGLKHEDCPERGPPVRRSIKLLSPHLAHQIHVEEAFPPKPPGVQQRVRPVTERAAKPLCDRRSETLLRSIDQSLRNIAIEQPPQKQFPLAIANLHRKRYSRSKLDNAVVQVWSSRLQTYAHAGAVNFYKYVVWEVTDRVLIHHRLRQGR